MATIGISLGELVFRAREKAGLTHAELADRLGFKNPTTSRTVQRIESGEDKISIEKLQVVLKEADLKLEQCLCWPGEPTPSDRTLSIVTQLLFRHDAVSDRLAAYVEGMFQTVDAMLSQKKKPPDKEKRREQQRASSQ